MDVHICIFSEQIMCWAVYGPALNIDDFLLALDKLETLKAVDYILLS